MGIEITTQPVGGYGLFEAVLKTADGRTFYGGGLTPEIAAYRARRKAQENQR